MATDALRQLSSFCCRVNDKGAAIRLIHLSCDQTAIDETIEDAGQCRSFVGQSTMEIGNRGWCGVRERRQNMRFTLRQPRLTQIIKVKSDPVGRPVNWMNKVMCHQV